jgi:hypothetical protein
MKKFTVLLLYGLFISQLSAQLPMAWCNNAYHSVYGYDINFNTIPDSSVYYIRVDSTLPGNIWQTGIVNKPYFTTGLSGPRALVTDTLLPYPVNNTSAFYFKIVNCWGIVPYGAYEGFMLQLVFSVNTDTLQDGGTIEVSHNGSPFINIVDDPLVSTPMSIYPSMDIIQSLGQPGFSGTIHDYYTVIWYSYDYSAPIDTITFRLVFASDAVQTNKDGWMVSDIMVLGIYEGINDIYKSDLVTVFPNPANSEVFIKRNYEGRQDATIEISDLSGRSLLRKGIRASEPLRTEDLAPGVYLLKYTEGGYFTVKKIVIAR